MPYEIKKYKSGWRVYSPDGNALSKKPLSLKRAKAQRIAVNLSELRQKSRLKGGGIYKDALLETHRIVMDEIGDLDIPQDRMITYLVGFDRLYNDYKSLMIQNNRSRPRKNELYNEYIDTVNDMIHEMVNREEFIEQRIQATRADEERNELQARQARDREIAETAGDKYMVFDSPDGKLYLGTNEAYGEGKPRSKFKNQLEDAGINPDDYLKIVRTIAKRKGYTTVPDWSDNNKHKLMIKTPEGNIRRFGAVGYGDHLIWSWLENEGKVPKGTAKQKRNVFNKSHTKIKGDWKDDKYSPNQLALSILW
jgi:hypothetical protein